MYKMLHNDNSSRSVARSSFPPVLHQNNRPSKSSPRIFPASRNRSAGKREVRATGPPLLFRGVTSSSSERFMDRDFMQQMQRRLLDQHEDTLRRRIRERQDEEAQRERHLILTGVIPSPPSSVISITTPPHQLHTTKRILPQVSGVPRMMQRRSPRPRTARRSMNASPRPPKKVTRNEEEEDLAALADELDEAVESLPPPSRPPHPRPRLALLMQACRAVVGAHGSNEMPVLPARCLPEKGEGEELSMLRFKYESPLIAQLREVESVDELYRLAEMIVASTKHP